MAHHTPDVKQKTITPLVLSNVKKDSIIFSDEWHGYKKIGDHYPHDTIDHSNKEYVRDIVHTNTIESYWAIIKRSYIGVYHWWSKKHLHRYMREFSFRFNRKNFNNLYYINNVLYNGIKRVNTFKDIVK